MELDDLKNTWQSISDSENKNFNDKQIVKMTRQTSKNLIAKMLRNFYFELSTGPIFTASVLLVQLPDIIRYSCLIFVLLFSIFFFKPFYRFYQLLTGFDNLAQDLNGYLKKQIELLTSYINWYEKVNIIIMPFALVFMILVNRYMFDPKIFTNILPSNWVTLTVIWLISNVVMYFFIKWYVKLLYRNHLHQLQKTLNELESES